AESKRGHLEVRGPLSPLGLTESRSRSKRWFFERCSDKTPRQALQHLSSKRSSLVRDDGQQCAEGLAELLDPFFLQRAVHLGEIDSSFRERIHHALRVVRGVSTKPSRNRPVIFKQLQSVRRHRHDRVRGDEGFNV